MEESNEHKVTTLDELYEYLKRFSLSDSLFVIAIANNAFKYGIQALSDDAHKNAVAWIQDNWKEPVDRAAVMMRLTRIARFLLLSRANDYKSVVMDTGTPEILHALFLVSTLHEKEVEGEIKSISDVTRVMGRLGQWQFPLQMARDVLIGRGYLLFVEIPKKLNLRYDFDKKMQEHFGMDALQFIASGVAAWTMSTGVLKYKLTIEIDALKSVVTTETLDKFVELSSGTPEEYRRCIRGEEWKDTDKLADIYALDPLFKMPAIRVERSGKLESGQYVVPQPLYLLHRASLGMFHLLSDKERELAEAEGKSGKNEFRDVFGDVYREYVARQLAAAVDPVHFVDLDEEIETKALKPDFALIKNGTCILVEVKTTFLTLNPRMLFDTSAASAEVGAPKGSFKKGLDQLNAFETEIKEGRVSDTRFTNVSKVVKVLVGFEDLYLANAFLLPLAKELYGSQADCLQIATLSDIEIVGARLGQGLDVVEALEEKISTQEMNEWSLGMFLQNKSKGVRVENAILKRAFEDFMSLISGLDYTDGKDPLNRHST